MMKAILVLSLLLAGCAPAVQTYRVYLPLVSQSLGLHGKGLASTTNGAFAQALGAQWYYVWAFCDAPRCVPMMRNWDLPPTFRASIGGGLPPTFRARSGVGGGLPRSCPPILMLGNEPNAIEPFGRTKSPEEAAAISQTIRAMCPDTWLVSGNVALPQFLGISGILWLQLYLAAGGQADQLGVHCYASPNGNAQQCVQALGDLVTAFPRADICVTEFGTYRRELNVWKELLDYIQSNFHCYAAFTDRDANWQIYGTDLNLINVDGTLNEYGRIYQERAR